MTQTNEFNQRGNEAIERSQANGNDKFCPFSQGHPNGPQPCNPNCKLHRSELKGYECIFHELRAITWNTKKKK